MVIDVFKVLEESGPRYCSDAVLIAAICGASEDNIKKLLADYPISSFPNIMLSTYKTYGITKKQALRLIAATTLHSRMGQRVDKITQSDESYKVLRAQMYGLQVEEFWVLLMSNSGAVLGCKKIASGGITGTVVDIRMVAKMALDTPRCTAVIAAHNHPSGNAEPSAADVILTKKLFAGLATLDIRLLDHIIVTDNNGYYSFTDNGVAPF